MSFRCIKAFMHAFSGRFSRTCLEGISFNFFVCFIFNVSLGSAPKRKNFDIQRNTRVASGGQFTLNYHTPSHIYSNRFQMDIFLGKFNRVSEEGYEKFLTGLNLNYLLRLSKDEVVVVMYLVRVMIMRSD